MTTVTLFVVGGQDLVDVTFSRADGGAKLDMGVRELAEARFSGVKVLVGHDATLGLADLRSALESGESALIQAQPQIVLLSIANEVSHLAEYRGSVGDRVRHIESELSAVIDLVKDKVGAHVLVANASTLDPSSEVFNYHDLEREPLSLCAHRLDLMLIGVSHSTGISVIDIDRKIAEMGGATGLEAALSYTEAGCRAIADEIVRVVADYGFFDDRPLLAQVGAQGGRS